MDGVLSVSRSTVGWIAMKFCTGNPVALLTTFLTTTDMITDSFTFWYFKKKFLSCSLCTCGGRNGSAVMRKSG